MPDQTPAEIINILRDRGLNDYDIAKAVGTSQATIHRVRTGETKDPRYSLVRALERLVVQSEAA